MNDKMHFKTKKIRRLLFLILFLVSSFTAQKISAQNLELTSIPNESYSPKVLSLSKACINSVSNTTIVLDSIKEYIFSGYNEQNYKWFFTHNYTGQAVQSKRIYYNTRMQPTNVYEVNDYNSENKIIRYTKYLSTELTLTINSENYEAERIEYEYNTNNQLSKISYLTTGDTTAIEEYHYNDNQQIEYITYNTIDTTHYIYNDNQQLIYEWLPDGGGKLYKYSYEIIPNSKKTIKQLTYTPYSDINNPGLVYFATYEYCEEYDNLNHLIHYSSKSTSLYNAEVYKNKADYTYNAFNQFETINLFIENENQTINTNRIQYIYNTDHNLTQYLNEIYDAKINAWRPEIQKDYYYSEVAVGLTEKQHAEILVYPNPASELIFLNVSDKESKTINVKIVSTNGKILMSKNVQAPKGEISISHLKNGIYIVTIPEFGFSKKLVINR